MLRIAPAAAFVHLAIMPAPKLTLVFARSFYSVYIPMGQTQIALLDSSKSVYTSPAATVYLCQRSSKLQDELSVQCAPLETGSYNTYHINKLV